MDYACAKLLHFLLAASFVISSRLLYVYFSQRRLARAWKCKPAIKCRSWDPLLGLDQFVSIQKAHAQGRMAQAYKELHDTYGSTFELRQPRGTSIHTTDPENIQTINTSSFDNWGVGPIRRDVGLPFIGRGISTDDGPFWKYSRALIRPTFKKTEIANLPNFEHHVGRLLELIPADGSTFDLVPLAKRLFLDTSSEFLFGRSTESLLGADMPAEAKDFVKSFDRCAFGLGLLMLLGRFRWPLYLDVGWRNAAKKVHAFVEKPILAILERQRQEKQSQEKRKAGLKRPDALVGTEREPYILMEEMAKLEKDPYKLLMQAINVFFPARDTIANAFSNSIFFLARDSNEWTRLREEVLALGSHQLDYETVRSVRTARAIVNETLRLHPAVSRSLRISLRDTVLPRGGGVDGLEPIFVPKGTYCAMDLYSLQHDEQIWGNDADVFRPSRWLEPGRPLWEAKWQYEPFLGGIRMCPAQNMAVTQMMYLLIRFAQTFETLQNRDPVYQWIEREKISVESRNGVKIALQRA